jgi:hypothetical protein
MEASSFSLLHRFTTGMWIIPPVTINGPFGGERYSSSRSSNARQNVIEQKSFPVSSHCSATIYKDIVFLFCYYHKVRLTQFLR